jgi:hypothetical protein
MQKVKVTENPDGSFSLEWDPNDPTLSFLNNKTQEEISLMICEGLKDILKSKEDDS